VLAGAVAVRGAELAMRRVVLCGEGSLAAGRVTPFGAGIEDAAHAAVLAPSRGEDGRLW